MFERFTERARQVVVLAQLEARALKHNYIGTEHILLGLVRENEGVAARILLDFDADAAKIHEAIIRALGAEGPSELREPFVPVPASPPVAPEVVAELERLRSEKEAAIEAREFENAAVLSERERHLRRAALKLEQAWAGRPEPSPAMPPSTVALKASEPRRARGMHLRSQLAVVVAGWLLFGVAAGLGLLVGRLIWG